MVKAGPTTRSLGMYSVLDAIEIVSKEGLSHLDIFVEPPYIEPLITPKSELKQIKEKGAELGVDFSFHLGFHDINIASLNEPIRKLSEEEIIWSIEAAKYLSAETLTLHAGHYYYGHKDPLKKEVLDLAIESLRRIQKKAEDAGMQLCVENLAGEMAIFGSYSHLERVVSEIPSIGITMDISHIYPHSHKDFIDHFRSHIKHIHISDASHDGQHLMFGEGEIDFSEVLPLINDWYQGYYSFEGKTGRPENLKKSVEFMEQILSNKTKIKEGIKE